MFENSIYLVFSDTREPLEKVIYTGTVLEVFKECLDRNPCTTKDPGTTYFVWGAFYGGAGRPIEHGNSVALGLSSSSRWGSVGKIEQTLISKPQTY
jgi:hypothetical protein